MKKTAIILIIGLALALAFFACDDKGDTHTHEWGKWVVTTEPTTTTEGEETRTCNTCGATETQAVAKLPSCACNPKEHYLPCDCGTTDCTCEVIPRGYITEYETNKKIPIYQSVGVPDDKAIAMTNRITDPSTGYANAGNSNKRSVADKIQKIVIVEGDDVSCTPEGVVSIGVDCTVTWNNIIVGVIQPIVNPVPCTITFDSNGGTAVSSQTVLSGEKITEPQNVTKDGYTLEGWYQTDDFQYKWDFNWIATSSRTLYAKWIE